MTTKFSSIMVIAIGNHRQLAKLLKPFQLEYLKALGVTADAFTVPLRIKKAKWLPLGVRNVRCAHPTLNNFLDKQ